MLDFMVRISCLSTSGCTMALSEITIPTKDGSGFCAWIAAPQTRPAPAILVIQEIFGVNDELLAKCETLASQGFLAVAPDLFWRLEPRVQLTDRTEAEWEKALDLYRRFDVDKGVADLRAALHTIRGHAWCSGKVGAVGYCLGGKLAWLMAARSSIDCAVSYYGVGIEALLEEAPAIRHPLMMHIAGRDEFVPADARNKIHQTMRQIPQVVIHDYPEAKHAFTRLNGQNYDAQAAKDAHARTLGFLTKTLGLTAAA